jgi:hypothetical protein
LEFVGFASEVWLHEEIYQELLNPVGRRVVRETKDDDD